MVANRVVMGRGLTSPRCRWVAFDDALIFTLNNDAAKRSNRDYAAFYPGEERLLKRYLADLNLTALPSSLNEYLKKVVTATLERQKQNRAVGVKFAAAYMRKSGIHNHDQSRQQPAYSRCPYR